MSVNEELLKITHAVPKELGKRIIKREVDTRSEEILRAYLIKHDQEIPPQKRRFMWDLIRSGALRQVTETEDKNITDKIDRYYDHAIKKARRDGRLPDPKRDRFFRQHMR